MVVFVGAVVGIAFVQIVIVGVVLMMLMVVTFNCGKCVCRVNFYACAGPVSRCVNYCSGCGGRQGSYVYMDIEVALVIVLVLMVIVTVSMRVKEEVVVVLV